MCGDLLGALQVAQNMEQASLPLQLVECTTLLKGHLAVGDLEAAERLREEMARKGVALDQRGFNTLLRGAVTPGERRRFKVEGNT